MMDPSPPWAMWKSLFVSWANRPGKSSLPELLKGIGTGNIGIQDKER